MKFCSLRAWSVQLTLAVPVYEEVYMLLLLSLLLLLLLLLLLRLSLLVVTAVTSGCNVCD